MTQTNDIKPVDNSASHRVFAWFTLLPFAIWIVLGVIVGLGVWLMDKFPQYVNESFSYMAAMIVGFMGVALYLPGYLIFGLAAFIGVILSFTTWKNSLTRFLWFLVWFDIATMILSIVGLVGSFFL